MFVPVWLFLGLLLVYLGYMFVMRTTVPGRGPFKPPVVMGVMVVAFAPQMVLLALKLDGVLGSPWFV